MASGLFGKLPVKRDFIAVNAPRRFLETWETWMQAGLATSRLTMGGRWGEAYNQAPLWRFWLGADLCGEPALGAWTPSVDGVGRAFPLTLFTFADTGALPPPEIDAQEDWFRAAETKLLEALDPQTEFESFTRSLAGLPAPNAHEDPAETAGLSRLADGGVLGRDVGDQFAMAFRAARRFDHRRAFAGESFWWTIGGEGFPPLALAIKGLPPPARFADFLTGVFESQGRAPP